MDEHTSADRAPERPKKTMREMLDDISGLLGKHTVPRFPVASDDSSKAIESLKDAIRKIPPPTKLGPRPIPETWLEASRPMFPREIFDGLRKKPFPKVPQRVVISFTADIETSLDDPRLLLVKEITSKMQSVGRYKLTNPSLRRSCLVLRQLNLILSVRCPRRPESPTR